MRNQAEHVAGARHEFADLRPQAALQRRLQDLADQSPQALQLQSLARMTQSGERVAQLEASSVMTNGAVPPERRADIRPADVAGGKDTIQKTDTAPVMQLAKRTANAKTKPKGKKAAPKAARNVTPTRITKPRLKPKTRYYTGGRKRRGKKKSHLKRFKHDIDIGKYVVDALKKLPATHKPTHTNIQPLTGAAGKSEVVFNKMTPTSEPANLNNWPKNEDLGIIRDKNNNHTLTRMHQIRGRFGGESKPANMFLGTALSNNFHENSHFAKTESWIEQALPQAKTSVISYTVEPQFGTVPTYISNRIANANGRDDTWKQEMTAWCEQATPSQYITTFTHYYIDDKLRLRSNGPISKTLSAEV